MRKRLFVSCKCSAFSQRLIIVISILNSLTAFPLCIDSREKTIELDFRYFNLSILQEKYIELPKKIMNNSRLCVFTLLIRYTITTIDLVVKFDTNHDISSGETNRIHLITSVPLDEDIMESIFNLACNDDLCTERYYHSFLGSGRLNWLFNLRKELEKMQEKFIKKLQRKKDDDDDDDRKYKLKCLDKNDDSAAITCPRDLCSHSMAINGKSSFSCGTSELEFDDQQVQIHHVITEKSKDPLMAYAYACNKNKCNGVDAALYIEELIDKHYNISNWLKSSTLFLNETDFILSTTTTHITTSVQVTNKTNHASSPTTEKGLKNAGTDQCYRSITFSMLIYILVYSFMI